MTFFLVALEYDFIKVLCTGGVQGLNLIEVKKCQKCCYCIYKVLSSGLTWSMGEGMYSIVSKVQTCSDGLN